MRITKVQQAAEAICGNLHGAAFVFMGETDNGASTWFTRGTVPQIMRVEVVRSALAPVVLVNVEHPNVSIPGKTLKMRKTLQIQCDVPEGQLAQLCADTSVRVLELFRDLLEGKNAAGPEEARASLAHKEEYDV